MDTSLTVGRIEQLTFTAGPWTVRHENDLDMPFAVMAGDLYVATPHLNVPGSVEANARLIAAAPDMLAALTSLANEASAVRGLGLQGVIGITNDRCLRRRIVEARAAIAKAGGRA